MHTRLTRGNRESTLSIRQNMCSFSPLSYGLHKENKKNKQEYKYNSNREKKVPLQRKAESFLYMVPNFLQKRNKESELSRVARVHKLQYSASQFSVNIYPHFSAFFSLIASFVGDSVMFAVVNLSSLLHTDFHRKKRNTKLFRNSMSFPSLSWYTNKYIRYTHTCSYSVWHFFCEFTIPKKGECSSSPFPFIFCP